MPDAEPALDLTAGAVPGNSLNSRPPHRGDRSMMRPVHEGVLLTHRPTGLRAFAGFVDRKRLITPARARARLLLAARVRRHACGGFPNAALVRSYDGDMVAGTPIPGAADRVPIYAPADRTATPGLDALIAARIRRERSQP